jgi:endonuclease/exonuclease/phosphatase family metal-dependent hydrolase
LIDSQSDQSTKPELEILNYPAEVARAPESQNTLTIATYNLRYGAGPHLISSGLARRAGLMRHKSKAHRVGKNIQRMADYFNSPPRFPKPDVIALQEADRLTQRSGGHHVAKELAEKLGMSLAHLSALNGGSSEQGRKWYLDFEEQIPDSDPGRTGIAFLQNGELKDVASIDLPWFGATWRPRLGLSITIEIDGTRVLIINVHIDPHATLEEQLSQHESVITRASAHDGPALIAGDFNTLSRGSAVAVFQFMKECGFESPMSTGTATWRSGPIRLHTDWFFTRGLKIPEWGVASDLRYSDHWPVWLRAEVP